MVGIHNRYAVLDDMDPPESSEASPEDRAEPAADGFKLTEEQCATIKNAMAALDIKYKPAWARWVKEVRCNHDSYKRTSLLTCFTGAKRFARTNPRVW